MYSESRSVECCKRLTKILDEYHPFEGVVAMISLVVAAYLENDNSKELLQEMINKTWDNCSERHERN